MGRYFMIIVSALLLMTGCRTTKYVEVPILSHDTTVVFKYRTDSVVRRDSFFQFERGDTVFIKDIVYIDRIKEIHDSIYVSKVDTPTQVVKEEVKKRLTVREKIYMGVGKYLWWLILLAIAFIAFKFVKYLLNKTLFLAHFSAHKSPLVT